MHEIEPGRLWIGNALEARDLKRVLDLGVEAIVDLAMQELPLPVTRELVYLRIPIVDGGGNDARRLATAIDAVVKLSRCEVPTLVFCSAGMSRSPAIVAAALSLVHNRPPDEVLLEIAARMPHDVSPVLWRDVLAAADSLRPAPLQ
ncbi:MAG TPA: dual specificity protein phosphatase [Pirellulaceae bacterium]|nr:dual specificity protein phosphatase [Pirellulaceae bacterium]